MFDQIQPMREAKEFTGLAPIKTACTGSMERSFMGLIFNDKSYFNYFRSAESNKIE